MTHAEFARQAATGTVTLGPLGRPPEVRHAILENGETEFDELVAFDAMVHLECMDDNHWWLAVTSGGKTVHVNLSTKRAKIHTTVEEDA